MAKRNYSRNSINESRYFPDFDKLRIAHKIRGSIFDTIRLSSTSLAASINKVVILYVVNWLILLC